MNWVHLFIKLAVVDKATVVRPAACTSQAWMRTMHSSAFSTSWWTDSVALYGSTTVSDTCMSSISAALGPAQPRRLHHVCMLWRSLKCNTLPSPWARAQH